MLAGRATVRGVGVGMRVGSASLRVLLPSVACGVACGVESCLWLRWGLPLARLAVLGGAALLPTGYGSLLAHSWLYLDRARGRHRLPLVAQGLLLLLDEDAQGSWDLRMRLLRLPLSLSRCCHGVVSKIGCWHDVL